MINLLLEKIALRFDPGANESLVLISWTVRADIFAGPPWELSE